jgi:hypothetical protein
MNQQLATRLRMATMVLVGGATVLFGLAGPAAAAGATRLGDNCRAMTRGAWGFGTCWHVYPDRRVVLYVRCAEDFGEWYTTITRVGWTEDGRVSLRAWCGEDRRAVRAWMRVGRDR